MKRAFNMKQKVSSIIFKGLSIKQITQIYLEGESPTLMVIDWPFDRFGLKYWANSFSKKFCKFHRKTAILKNICERLLSKIWLRLDLVKRIMIGLSISTFRKLWKPVFVSRKPLPILVLWQKFMASLSCLGHMSNFSNSSIC